MKKIMTRCAAVLTLALMVAAPAAAVEYQEKDMGDTTCSSMEKFAHWVEYGTWQCY